ncbi:MAG: lipid-binding SYLF domain-containing protein [Planctomycetota bacterium]|jgi:lipid-binding SYLF domain-containing protein
MNTKIFALLALVVVIITGCRTPKGATVSEKRAYVFDMRDDVLAELYQKKPEAKEKIANAAGYGTFSNININLFLLSSGNGYGVIRNNATGKDTFMRMQMIGAGLGAGVKDFRAVIIFKSQDALHDFIEEGWEFGGHADAAAKADETGAEVGVAAEVTGNMEIYNFTESGIALQATAAGTKYWKDDDLN